MRVGRDRTRAGPDLEAFPATGTVTLYRWAAPTSHVELSIETTALQPGRRYAVTLREWDTNAAVADAYLTESSTATMTLPYGTYRVQYASGGRWEGDAAAFGSSTVAREIIEPQTYQSHPDWISRPRIILNPPQGTMATRSIPTTEFTANR